MWWAHRTPSQAHTPTSIFPKCPLRSLLAKTNLSVQHSIGFPHKGDFYFLDTPSDVNGKQILSLQLSGKMQQLIGFRPGNVNGLLSSSNCSFVGHITLRGELFFVFLSEEDKRRLCLYRVKPLKLPNPELMDQSILLSFVKLVFRVQAFVYSYSDGYKCVRCYKCTTVKPWLNTVSRQQATPAQQRSYSIHAASFEYRLLSLNGHLELVLAFLYSLYLTLYYKMDTWYRSQRCPPQRELTVR